MKLSPEDLLPGFAEAKARLEEKGYSAEWITETVDPNEAGAVFIPSRKRMYRSDCPYYKGYWLCGHIGSVECEAHAELIPGLQWDILCSKDFTKCKFYEKGG